MYLKLINSNVKKTLQDYQIYIITLVVSSALFFSFISLSSPCNTIIADGTKYSDAMFRQTINLTVGLVSLIFFVLVNYVNNHMIKRRAKEFSIYMLLGMEQKKIAFLYFVETLEVGLLAILIGTIAGTLLSGALTSIVILATGGDFDYKLGFYPDTFFKTMLFFIFVFILVGVFNTTKLSKTKLINLLNQQHLNEVIGSGYSNSKACILCGLYFLEELMKDIIKLIKYTDISYMKRQIGCMIFLLLNTVLTLVYPSCISVIVDQGVAKGSIEDIIKYSILMFVLGILIMITNYVQQIKYAKLGREICEILRNRMFEKLCKTNYKFWCENRVGDIITILDTDVSLVEKILTSIISCGILNILYFSGIIMVLLLCNVKTGFLITILVFLFVLLQKKNGKKVKRGMSELREKIGWFNSETQEMIHNMPDIQLIYPEKDLVNSYMQQNRLTNMSYIQQTKNMLEAKNIGWGFNILSIFSVLLIGGYAVLREDISVGILFSMIVYVQQLYSPAVALGETYNSIKNAQPSILRISTLLENKEMVEEADFCPEGSLKGNIIFKNVTFSYAQNTDPVFRNLNLSLKAGRIYGITGDNGMGKSTFIRLIAGLCMPDSGNIYIDDIEIKKYNVEYLRKHIGYLLQKPLLLRGKNPIDNIDTKRMMRYFNMGKKRYLEENVKGLSGGESQKLALAYLLSDKTKDIYILDEPTASVDLKSEEVICSQIRDALKGKTALIITHRRSILKICDEVIDFNKEVSYKNVRKM